MKYAGSRLFLILFFIFSTGLSLAEPVNIGLLKQKIQEYTHSGKYLRDVKAVASQAMQYMQSEITENKNRKHPEKLAIVLDIDETSLMNLANIQKSRYAATAAEVHQQILDADAPALAPIHALYCDALKHGIDVFFVTGRNTTEAEATIKNLHTAGYTRWSGLYFRPTKYGKKSIIPFKSNARKEITEKGYTIIASIGDQYSDLKGGYAKRGFKLPNPFYYLY